MQKLLPLGFVGIQELQLGGFEAQCCGTSVMDCSSGRCDGLGPRLLLGVGLNPQAQFDFAGDEFGVLTSATGPSVGPLTRLKGQLEQ